MTTADFILSALTLLALLVFCFYASYSVRYSAYVHCLCRSRSVGKTVVLSFDDGPDPLLTPRVLDVLKEHDAKAIFFLIGHRAASHEDIVRRIVAEGHQIGIHTYHHSNTFPLAKAPEMMRELLGCQILLQKITNGKPVKFFRPPMGVTNPNIARVVHRMNMQTVGWSIRSLDTLGRPMERVLRRITKQLHPGAVILLHDDRPESPELVSKLMEQLQERGYGVAPFSCPTVSI